MEYTFSDKKAFAPKYGNNDKAEQPATFHIRALTNDERNRLTKIEMDGDGDMRATPDMRGYFTTGVERIENLSVNGKAITTPAEFLKAPKLYGMFMEVAAEVISFSQSDEGDDRKN